MSAVPTRIGGGSVICFSPVDKRHRHTGDCQQIVGGVLQGAVAGLAICQLDDDDAFYLFGCDADWNVVTDTWHQSLDDAKEQAEFEYEGITETWQSPTRVCLSMRWPHGVPGFAFDPSEQERSPVHFWRLITNNSAPGAN